jgi:hypothetical protein
MLIIPPKSKHAVRYYGKPSSPPSRPTERIKEWNPAGEPPDLCKQRHSTAWQPVEILLDDERTLVFEYP